MSFDTLELSTNTPLNEVLAQLEAVISGERDWLANAANISSLIYHQISDLNWVGFYRFDGEELVLGPFQGRLACTRIAIGKGVCGTAFAQKKPLMVNDVHGFEGHIACDSASRSEIVVPFYTDTMSGVLDIDSPVLNRFNDELLNFFTQVAQRYAESLAGTS